MALKHVDGFDQLQAQAGAQLLSSLIAAGYSSSTGVAMTSGRKAGGYAIELQVSAGTAGESWSSRTNAIKQDLYGIAANNAGRWVAVGTAGSAAGSSDNLNWAPIATGVTANLKDIECNANTYIAVGDNGTVLRSTDGQIFESQSLPAPTANLRQVAWGDNIWVVVGSSGTEGMTFLSHDDGVTWESGDTAPAPILCVAFGNSTWITGGAAGQLRWSSNGTYWDDFVSGVISPINAVGFGATAWLFATGNDVRRSLNNGASWSEAAANIIPSGSLQGMRYADGRWIMVGDNATLRISDDNGSSWSSVTLAGATGALYGIGVSGGAQVAWAAVGSKSGNPAVAKILMSLAPPTVLTRRFSTTMPRFTIGFAHKANARGRIASVADLLEMDWAAGITIGGETGTAVPARNVWYFYELTIDKTARTVTLHINNQQDLVAPLPESVSTQVDFDFSWISENGAVTQIDDVYFVDTDISNGEQLIARLGPISVPIRMPDSDVVANWTPAAPGPHFLQVGLLPPSPESFVRSAVSGALDLYASSTGLPAGAGSVETPIIAVGLVVLAQKGDIDNRQLGMVMGAPGNQIEVIDSQLSTTAEYSYAVFEKAPGAVAWDAINTVNTPFGVIVRP